MRDYATGDDLVRDGDRPRECCLLLEGFACRYKLMPDGRRQIMSFHTPGDIPDLQSLHLGVMDHALSAIVPTSAAFLQHSDIRDLTQRFPGLLHAFWRDTLVDGAIFREWMIGMGRREAYQRLAHLLCEMMLRFKAVGLVSDQSFNMPVTQAEVGDALGLSTVHVNRVLQKLRENGLITWTKGTVAVLNWEALQEAGEFDPTYLHQDGRLYQDHEATAARI
nr:Crp/Fnr family transcriptional regulator [Pararoseomonas indoligenes]